MKNEDYRTLAAVRVELRAFAHFTEQHVRSVGLTVRQHQALLALRAAEDGELTVGQLADTLMLKPHTASGLADRLVASGLAERVRNTLDGRSVVLRLTARANELMTSLARAHREELKRIRPLLISLLSQLG